MPINLQAKKRLAARVIGCGVHRIRFDPDHEDAITDAITRQDIRGLISANKITVKRVQGTSRGRAHHKHLQQKKRGTKAGSKRGRKGARMGKKETYVKKVRSLRYILGVARDRSEINSREFWSLYKRIRGNTVRNKAHLRLLIEKEQQARTV